MRSLFIALGLFLGLCFVYITAMLSKTECFFTYTLDDAYIHLAMAKNFALHGIWGMTQYAFSSSSSSPIFTFLLGAIIYTFGDNELIPLVFNIFCSVFVIYFLNKYYSQYFNKSKNIVFAVLFTLFFAVLHLQIMEGMEHVLQVLIIVINIYCFQKLMNSGDRNLSNTFWFYFTIALMGLIRFESMFYFVSLAFTLMLIRNLKEALLTLVFGFAPILVFGYFNYQEVGYFFPNSVVVKGTQFDLTGNYFSQIKFLLFDKIFFNVTFYKVGLFPLIITFIFIFRDYRKKLSFRDLVSNNLLLIVWTSTLILHSLFGNFRGFFRYEAYVLTAFAMVLIPRLKGFFESPVEAFRKDKIMGVLIFCNTLLFIYKLGFAHLMIVNGSTNMYEQQVQSARFLKKYYNNSKVVANDIGAVCYFTDIHLFDIAGLGSKEMIPFNEKGKSFDDKFETFLIKYTLENDYELAIVYEEWFAGHVPKDWGKVAVLKINNNTNAAIDHVTIYSINPKIHKELKENVKKFNWNKNVQIHIID
ncbi:hypothetical protein [Chryseobacterium polytrichastri]|uniref:Glycosyltransferase RgtA/B/C/D-like domain-containing protein n=1 Tax=Chryseobacterium polytrichastri TaxID=1302687 RepID=A0A1M7I955_9FLAO|nr:hypothetical protein [Chryseobacterium polytrichastri]SHM37250.1 hypothetical protein SAMN05444267_104511 [Chryseobacterium polytrichastri]